MLLGISYTWCHNDNYKYTASSFRPKNNVPKTKTAL